MTEPVFEEFRRWAAALPAARAGTDLQYGIKLALERRSELLKLIEKNPRRALELAVPYAMQQHLPEEITALLEERVDAQGDLLVQSATLADDRGCMTTRIATLQDGRMFETYTYGRRSAMPTRDNIAIHGVALDGKLALSDLPGRVLEPAEVSSRLAAGILMEECPDLPGTGHQTDAGHEMVIALGDRRMTRSRSEDHAIAALLDEERAEQSGETAAARNCWLVAWNAKRSSMRASCPIFCPKPSISAKAIGRSRPSRPISSPTSRRPSIAWARRAGACGRAWPSGRATPRRPCAPRRPPAWRGIRAGAARGCPHPRARCRPRRRRTRRRDAHRP